ncbi:phage protein [Methylobacterium sp. 1030]|uniref:phage protein n=1 Tax=Methylobacterium sp. 1030 TaxID=3156404 RepID=UPI000733C67E|nr:hypothetical protein SB3_08840 [Methylobacterium radiotolerans]KTS49257.1 hypothetical protein SB2_06795 [Methylobacterium radiotolerans]
MAAAPITYSFADVVCSLTGPGGSFTISEGGLADEGITLSMTDDKTSMVTGADGYGMHSLHAAKAGRVTIRLLKNSPINRMLQDLYNYQQTSSAYTGQNTLVLSNPVWGDDHQCSAGAFVKLPDNVNAKDGGTMEWPMNFIFIDNKLGDGSLAL